MSAFELDIRPADNHYLFSTVRLEGVTASGATSVGTGFFYGNKPSWHESSGAYLITNNHVLEGCEAVRICFHVTSKQSDHARFRVEGRQIVTIKDPALHWAPHPDPSVDLCAARVTRLLASVGGVPDVFFTTIGTHTLPPPDEQSRYPAVMQIAMIGYPNGLWDDHHNLPVTRRGSTASHPAVAFQGRPDVLVDLACFPGSSGSPILFHDKSYFASAQRFLGVLYAGPTISTEGEVVAVNVPTSPRAVARMQSMMHLGFAIKSSEVPAVVRAAARLGP